MRLITVQSHLSFLGVWTGWNSPVHPCLPHMLPIALCAIMRFAKHLAVLDICGATLAPGGHVVSIHLGKFPEAGAIIP